MCFYGFSCTTFGLEDWVTLTRTPIESRPHGSDTVPVEEVDIEHRPRNLEPGRLFPSA